MKSFQRSRAIRRAKFHYRKSSVDQSFRIFNQIEIIQWWNRVTNSIGVSVAVARFRLCIALLLIVSCPRVYCFVYRISNSDALTNYGGEMKRIRWNWKLKVSQRFGLDFEYQSWISWWMYDNIRLFGKKKFTSSKFTQNDLQAFHVARNLKCLHLTTFNNSRDFLLIFMVPIIFVYLESLMCWKHGKVTPCQKYRNSLTRLCRQMMKVVRVWEVKHAEEKVKFNSPWTV